MDDISITYGTDVEGFVSICDQWRWQYQLQKQYQFAKGKEVRNGVLREVPDQGEFVEVVDVGGTLLGTLPVCLVFLFRYLKEALQIFDCQILRSRSIADVPVVDVGCLRAALVLEMDRGTRERWRAYVCRLGRRIKELGLGDALHTEIEETVLAVTVMILDAEAYTGDI